MSFFRCRKCKVVYEDYYPTDDTCCKCNSGTIRILQTTSQEDSVYVCNKS